MGNEPESFDSNRPPTLAERVEELTWRLDEFRRRPLAAVLTVAICFGIGLALWWSGRAPDVAPVEDTLPHIQLVTTLPPTTLPKPVIVHVAGAVERPGVYELASSARLIDAIEMAGGATAEGEPQRLNLAAPVVDGMQIRVPVAGETVTVMPMPGVGSGAGPVNINTALADQLEDLPGVGPATAAAILTYREANGPFAAVDGLLSVPGIGPAKLETIRNEATVG